MTYKKIREIISKINILNKQLLMIFLLIIFIITFFCALFSAPIKSNDSTIHIYQGESIDTLSNELKNLNVIRYNFIFKFFLKYLKSGQGIISGDYLINKNSPVWSVALQVGRGIHNIKPIKITIREGLNNDEIANLLESKLPQFNKKSFIDSTYNKQGYLFPDTYFYYPLDTENDIILKFSTNFDKRIKNINSLINSSDKTFREIIIMASILEGEAGGKDDIEIISGILWKRISLGMPLQVDVDKSTYDIKGLPNSPLNNPGLLSIKAAASPIMSNYLYYIHDKNGKVHYATTFDEHKKNIALYLKL